MSNVIAFLEAMGQDASLNRASPVDLEKALSSAEIDARCQEAIVHMDPLRLQSLMGADTIVCCAIAPGKHEDDDEEQEPSREDEEISARSNASDLVMVA